MSAEFMFWFWMVVLCAPGVVPAVIFYMLHCKERSRGENRFPLGLYVVALLICAFVAFFVGTGWGVSFACSGPSPSNLCGLLGFMVVGPLSSIIAVSVLSWLITYFPPLQMKRLVLTGVFLFLLAGGYYFRDFFFDYRDDRNLYQYNLQSGDLDDLQRFAPVIETQMRELPGLKDVSLNSHIKSHQATVDVDSQRATASGGKELAKMTISFSLAPRVTLADAIGQIHDIEIRLALPATITTSVAKAE